ncbi:hypothetical protein [Thermoflavimicrobium dichotomicum]|uniref:hypothetical protein n=1 Tax=Thermoflavimicrobium dichotomicum TaxID=46223 RepID=UPI000B878102|nr:hypothetical protein [Thermoflavimicrobium dichotomicum]
MFDYIENCYSKQSYDSNRGLSSGIFVKNGHYAKAKKNNSKNAKVDVVDHIQKTIGISLDSCHSPKESDGFNIWCFKRK